MELNIKGLLSVGVSLDNTNDESRSYDISCNANAEINQDGIVVKVEDGAIRKVGDTGKPIASFGRWSNGGSSLVTHSSLSKDDHLALMSACLDFVGAVKEKVHKGFSVTFSE